MCKLTLKAEFDKRSSLALLDNHEHGLLIYKLGYCLKFSNNLFIFISKNYDTRNLFTKICTLVVRGFVLKNSFLQSNFF